MAKKDKKSTVEIRNKKAGFEYEFLESFTAGIVLNGTEIKSIRAGKASLVDSWCYFVNGELFVKNMNVAEYWWGSAFSRQDPKRDRKLLLTKKELRKLARAVKKRASRSSPRASLSPKTAMPNSTSPSPVASANSTSARQSRKRICVATTNATKKRARFTKRALSVNATIRIMAPEASGSFR